MQGGACATRLAEPEGHWAAGSSVAPARGNVVGEADLTALTPNSESWTWDNTWEMRPGPEAFAANVTAVCWAARSFDEARGRRAPARSQLGLRLTGPVPQALSIVATADRKLRSSAELGVRGNFDENGLRDRLRKFSGTESRKA